MNILAALLLILAALLLVGYVYEAIAERRDRQRLTPPGRLVDVGGHRLHVHVTGSSTGKPVVILEAGMASISSNWAWVQPDLSRITQVVAYDRAGLGWSDDGQKPRDAERSVRELRSALQQAGIKGPYVLAGHSYGGLVMRLFAGLYPDEVAGLVLVDSSHPDQWLHIPASKGGSTVAISNRVTAWLTRFGVIRLFNMTESFIAGLPPQAYAEMKACLAAPRAWLTGADGLIAWRDTSRQQVNSAKLRATLPLIVISVTEQDMYAEVLTRLQDELPALSSNSKHIVVQGATHYSLLAKQEYAAAVTGAILQLVETREQTQVTQTL